MEKTVKFTLPSPNFNKSAKDAFKPRPHFLTPSGMSLLPREKQPPPMYGKHGATVPARYLKQPTEKFSHYAVAAPSSEKQYCESCELELQSLKDLKLHRAQHEKCPVAGCLYKGHPSVMDKHINALHASGLFEKFKKLNTPEEIAAWREERRKRYPTLANVLLKQKAKEQRQKRGERLDASKNRFGKINDRKRAQHNESAEGNKNFSNENKVNHKSNKKNRRKNRNKRLKNEDFKVSAQSVNNANNDKMDDVSELSCCGIKMFAGTSLMEDYVHINVKKKNASKNNVLFSLVGMYGSDDDDDEESEEYKSESSENELHDSSVKALEEIKSNDNSMIDSDKKPESCENVIIDNKNEEFKSTTPIYENKRIINTDISNEICKADIGSTPNLINSDNRFYNTILQKENTDKYVVLETAQKTPSVNDNSSDETLKELPIHRISTEVPKRIETIIATSYDELNKNEFNSTTSIYEDKGVDNTNISKESCKVNPDFKQNFVNTTPTEENVNKSIIHETIEKIPSSFNGYSSDETPEELPVQRESTEVPKMVDKITTTSDEPNAKRCKIAEQPTFSKRKLLKRKSGLDYRKARIRKQNTMLEKLLESDIRHERNVLLQCVRYVCENNFFGIGQNKNEKPD